MLKQKINNTLYSVSDIAVKQSGALYRVLKAVVKKGGSLYTIYEKVKARLGSLFMQEHAVTIQDYTIHFKFDD